MIRAIAWLVLAAASLLAAGAATAETRIYSFAAVQSRFPGVPTRGALELNLFYFGAAPRTIVLAPMPGSPVPAACSPDIDLETIGGMPFRARLCSVFGVDLMPGLAYLITVSTEGPICAQFAVPLSRALPPDPACAMLGPIRWSTTAITYRMPPFGVDVWELRYTPP